MRAFFKDFFREFVRNKGRFISVFFIVMLGAAFFAGIRSNITAMKASGDKYYNESKLMDIKIQGTLGMSEDDISAIYDIEGIEQVSGNYTANVLSKVESTEQVVRMIGLTTKMNKPTIIDGRMPKNEKECMVDTKYLEYSGLKIGDDLKIYSGTKKDIFKTFKYDTFKIVGTCSLPYYMDINRGHASIGDGDIDSFAVVDKDVFKTEVFTELNLRINNSSKLGTYTDKYKKLVNGYVDKITEVGKIACENRYADIYNEASEKIDDSENKIIDAEKELEDAKKEIEDGEKKIEDGEKTIREKEAELKKAKKTLASKEKELSKGKNTLSKKEKELKDGKKLLAEKEKELKEGKKTLETKEKELSAAKKLIKDKEKELEKGKKQFEDNLKIYEKNKAEFEEKKKQFEQNKPYLDEQTIAVMMKQLTDGEEQLNQGKKALDETEKQIKQGEEELAKGKDKIIIGEKELDKGRKEISNGEKEIDKGKKKIKDGEKVIKKAREKISTGEKQLKEAKDTIREGEEALKKGKKELEDKKKELKEAKEIFEKEEKKAKKKIKKGKKEIQNGKDSLKELEKPEWYITTREDIYSCKSYGADADRVDNLGEVFPIIFFLVAALVSLTAMTRMVEEQRQQIGILEALGYSNLSIGLRYMSFALLPTIAGSITGVLVGEKIFPYVIINTYKMLYRGLPEVILPYNLKQGFLAIILCVLCTGIATFTACNKAVRTKPSDLMRPKAPKLGRRVWLDRLFIWKYLNFSYKSTFRNLFRYKKRLCMTILGVGGCMGLLIVALGLHDSIAVIAKNQFTKLSKYEVTVYLDNKDSDLDKNEVYDTIKKYPNVSSIMPSYYSIVKLVSENEKKTVLLTVPNLSNRFSNFVVFNDRKTGRKYSLPNEGAVLSEKTAEELKLEVGDYVLMQIDGEKDVQVEIKYIIENYIDHYIYISKNQYKKLYDKDIEINQYLVNLKNNNSKVEKDFGEKIIKKEAVAGLWFMSDTVDRVDDMMESLTMVVYVLLVSAGLLAFVVLYNLNNINIAERKRELATLKVLGFYDNEVSAYVYRENILLTLLGIIAGLFIGTYLHHFIIKSISMEGVMFGLKIENISYIIGAIITIIFTVFVNFLMKGSLKDIDMIESLKSVE